MRTFFVTEFVSLDGVVEAPGGEEGYRHSGWTFDIEDDPARYDFKAEETFGTQTPAVGPNDPTWHNTTEVRDLDAVRALKAGDGGPIAVHGSATLARALHSSRLVDQWNLMLFPVILGSGKRLFPTDTESKQKLTLRETRTFTNGVQLSICQPSG